MKFLRDLVSLLLTFTCVLAVGAGTWRLATSRSSPTASEKPVPPITTKVMKENDLNTLILTDEAENRIGLQTVLVEKQSIVRQRVYGGELLVPIGASTQISSPMAGRLEVDGTLPTPGNLVRAGTIFFRLHPLLAPEGRAALAASLVDADGQVRNAELQLEAAKLALRRAERGRLDGTTSARQFEEANSTHAIGESNLLAAKTRRDAIVRAVGAEGNQGEPVVIATPRTGLLRSLQATSGQIVSSGAPLFEVVDLSHLWLRVSVPAGDRDEIDLTAKATVQDTNAAPVSAPPSANPITGTIDLYYQIGNSDGRWSPGRRLEVHVPLRGSREAVTLPHSAIIHDVHGGTWVYERIAPRTYVRRRVVINQTRDGVATLDRGLKEGASVVAAGVPELFGAETGFTK